MLYVLTGFKWFIGASCPEMVQKKSTSFRRVFFIFHQFSENDSPSNYMVHFWFSDYIPNCLFQSVYFGNLLSYTITKDFYDGRFKIFLKTK